MITCLFFCVWNSYTRTRTIVLIIEYFSIKILANQKSIPKPDALLVNSMVQSSHFSVEIKENNPDLINTTINNQNMCVQNICNSLFNDQALSSEPMEEFNVTWEEKIKYKPAFEIDPNRQKQTMARYLERWVFSYHFRGKCVYTQFL